MLRKDIGDWNRPPTKKEVKAVTFKDTPAFWLRSKKDGGGESTDDQLVREDREFWLRSRKSDPEFWLRARRAAQKQRESGQGAQNQVSREKEEMPGFWLRSKKSPSPQDIRDGICLFFQYPDNFLSNLPKV
jgi:hypothetical protein